MTCKTPLFLYLPTLLLITAAPLGGLNTTLTHTTVIHLRLDYLLNALMLAPFAPLWRLGSPRGLTQRRKDAKGESHKFFSFLAS